jgi:uncharacterized protein YggE
MARPAPLILVLLLVTAVALAAEPAASDARPRTVTVTGSGEATAEPDRAVVALAVQKIAPVMAKAREDVVATTQRFLALCKRLGIDDRKVRSSGLVIRPEYRWDPKTSQQVLTGYLVQRDLEVELGDLKRLGELMEGAVDAGVNQVSPPQLGSTRERDLRREAIAGAAKDAEANARILAETLGAKLGKPRELTANVAGAAPPVPMVRAMAMKAADAGAPETYATGTLHIEAQVTATFDLITN